MKRTLLCFSAITNTNQGLKGTLSPPAVNDGLESDTWYQVSAVSERAQGVFGEPVYAVAKTHREPARVVDTTVSPVPVSTDALAVMMRLDCSSAPMNEACGIMRYATYLEIDAACAMERAMNGSRNENVLVGRGRSGDSASCTSFTAQRQDPEHVGCLYPLEFAFSAARELT